MGKNTDKVTEELTGTKYYNEERERKATVYKVLKMYVTGGIASVKVYLNDEATYVARDTWADRVRKNLNAERHESVELEIMQLLSKFKISEDEFISNKTERISPDSSGGRWP